MLMFIEFLRSSLVLSAIAAISMGLSPGAAVAGEEKEEKDNERVVKVNCDRGQSVQRVLNRFANRTKPLVIIVKGVCDNEPSDDEGPEVQIERDKVEIIGDEEVGGTIPFLLVDGARRVGIGDNMTLARLTITAGQVEIGSETQVTIENGIFLGAQSLLRIDTEAPDEDDGDEESLIDLDSEDDAAAGTVTIMGLVMVENHSFLEVQREVGDGTVNMIDGVQLSLQSSLYIGGMNSPEKVDATVGNIQLSHDSHADFVGNVMTKEGGAQISCDSESRVWGDTGEFDVSYDPLYGMSCKGD